MLNGRLAILAGGISSRMKKSVLPQLIDDKTLIRDADLKAKSMIGVGKDHRPFLDYFLYNAMIDYNRDFLQFDSSRIERFAVISKDEEGFVTDIVEKPSADQIESLKGDDGIIGMSMNIFDLQYDMIYPFLQRVPLNPMRPEKELPEAVTLMINSHPRSLFAYLLSERVPDLTVKSDILPVEKYLETHFANTTFKLDE